MTDSSKTESSKAAKPMNGDPRPKPTAAAFSNYKRRIDDERAATALFANAVLLSRLLAVLDDFDRALDTVPPDTHEAWVEGIRLVERKLRGLLEAEGVTPIEATGQPFDPHLHAAVV